jgi:hypothetical protein
VIGYGRGSSDRPTVFRFEFQTASGDQAYAGNSPDPHPTFLADLQFTRRVLTLEAERRLSSRWQLGVQLPFIDQHVHNNQMNTNVDVDWKLGDAVIYSALSPWESEDEAHVDPFLSLHNFQFLIGLSLPTGDERVGDFPALHYAQTGSGSADPRLGATYYGRINRWGGAFADAGVVIDTGADGSGYRNGNLYAFGAGAALTPHRLVTLSLADETIIRWHNLQNGQQLFESGGKWNFLVARATAYPVDAVFIDLEVGIPIYRNVNIVQPVTGYNLSVAVGYRL